jgi:single-strand DNA-binding protein
VGVCVVLNRIVLIGRLTRDPELKYTQNNIPVANFALAVDREFKNSNGEKEVDFVDIIVWRKLAEIVANNLQKGRLVAVEGRLQVRSYEKDGQKRRVSEVVADRVQFLDWPKEKQGSNYGELAGIGTEVSFAEQDIPF